MKKLKIGIIGVGRLGYEHACNIANRVPGSELVAICDKDFDRAKSVAEELGITAVYSDAKDLCANPEVEAVAIITNTDSHVEMIKIAMDAGIDMIIANGTHPENLYRILDGEKVGTKFRGKKQIG